MTNRSFSGAIDDLDRRLLDAVQDDGRATLARLAEVARLSLSAARSRVRNLEETGVIKGYTASVDAPLVGFALRAVVRMKVHGSLYDKVTQVLADEPRIVRCLRVTGESCYVMEVVAEDMRRLEAVTSELARVGSITTDLVYETVADRAVPTSVV